MSKIVNGPEEQAPAEMLSVTNRFGNEKSAFDLDGKEEEQDKVGRQTMEDGQESEAPQLVLKD